MSSPSTYISAQTNTSNESYGHSKCLAEQLTLAANCPGVLETAALRPSIVFGKFDVKLAQRLMQGLDKNVVGPGDHMLDFVHVRDVAMAHVLCEAAMKVESNGIAGKAFFIGSGVPSTVKMFFDWGFGTPQPIPVGIVRALSKANVFLWKAIRFAPFGVWLYPESVETITASWWFPVFAARQAFGYAPLVPARAKEMMMDGSLDC